MARQGGTIIRAESPAFERPGGSATTLLLALAVALGSPAQAQAGSPGDDPIQPFVVAVNGEPQKFELVKGFAAIRRTWKKGDTVELNLPMPVRRVVSHKKVEANTGRVALERGPVVYCAEAVDNGGEVFNLVLPDDTPLETRTRDDLLGGVTVIEGRALGLSPAEDGRSVVTQEQDFVAVPFYAWSHRGEGEMAVWLPRRVDFRVP